MQTGGTSYRLSDSQVKSRFQSIANNALNWKNSTNRTPTTYLWGDRVSTTDSSDISRIQATLSRSAYSVVSLDPLITVFQLRPTRQISVNAFGTLSRSAGALKGRSPGSSPQSVVCAAFATAGY